MGTANVSSRRGCTIATMLVRASVHVLAVLYLGLSTSVLVPWCIINEPQWEHMYDNADWNV